VSDGLERAAIGAVRERAVALFVELGRQRIEYVVVRGGHLLERSEPGEMRVLVRESQIGAFEEIARRLRLESIPVRDGLERLWTSNGDAAPERLRIAVTTALGYGRLGLGTGPHETPVLRRRRELSGVSLASSSDELMDLVLHCVLDLGSFPEAHRARIATLLAELRADPPAAGRAAERVQQELAPALSWADLLENVVEGRWDELVSRRARLARHLMRRSPWSALRSLTARQGKRQTSPEAVTRGSAAETIAPAHQPATNGTAQTAGPTRPSAAAVSRKQIRGSSLMLIGRGLASALKFGSELIIVRYLTTGQYGAWTYALAAVSFFRVVSALGLNRAVARYVPAHLERGEIDKFYGVLAVVGSLTALASAAVIAAFWAFPRFASSLAGVAAEQPLDLLFILIFMVPLDTFDNALQGVCAALGMSRTLFFRRFLLYPGLRLVIALVLVAAAAPVEMLAWGYILAGVVGVGYYAWSVVARLRAQGLLRARWLHGVQLPFRTVLGYSASVMPADWCAVFMTTAGPLLLGYFTDMSAVALYMVVVPVAALNHLVQQAFVMLFEPSAARLVARGDRAGLERHYWWTAMWVSVLSFPLFALSFTASVPLTVLLFEARYAAAAPILSLLAVAQFIDAAAGFNAETLRVNGKVRWLIASNVVGVVALVGVSAALIPRMGALGAGIGTAVGQLCYTALKQMSVSRAVGVKSVDPEHAGFYLTMAAACALLLAVRILAPDNLWIIVPAVTISVLVVSITARRSLSVSETFPELGRFTFLRKILG
jgi:O-antigen/teichoic acid export membrane protein